MENSNRGGRGGRSFGGDRGGRSFGGGGDRGGRGGSRGGRGGRDFGDRPEMFEAVCSDCGEDCQVPFKPSRGKPVLCSSCFRGNEGGREERGGRSDRGDRGGRGDRGDRGDRGRREERTMHPAVCCECGRDFELPFRPTSDRPVFCSDCFEGKKGATESHGGNGGAGDEDLTEYFEEKFSLLNAKLDGIVRLLKGEPEAKPAKAKKAKKEVEAVVEEMAEIAEEKPKKAKKAKAKK